MAATYERVCDVGRTIFRKRIQGPPVLDAASFFPHAPLFTGSWRAIRTEALAIAGRLHAVPRFQELMPEQAPIAAYDAHDWRMFILKAYGREVVPNMARCPALATLLRQSPEVLSAVISFLAPGKHVPRHCGPFRGILRFHLGLSMPLGADGRPAAVLKIEDREHRLGDGDSLLWDDTYPHEVWNPGSEVRIALLLDVWRQGMPLDMELLSRLVVAVVQAGMRWRAVSYGS